MNHETGNVESDEPHDPKRKEKRSLDDARYKKRPDGRTPSGKNKFQAVSREFDSAFFGEFGLMQRVRFLLFERSLLRLGLVRVAGTTRSDVSFHLARVQRFVRDLQDEVRPENVEDEE